MAFSILVKLIFNVYKNLKIIFRNWTSLFLLVIGPLLLITLMGLTFAGSGFHDISIGLLVKEGFKPGEIKQSFDKIGKVNDYNDLSKCVENLKVQKEHICIELTPISTSAVEGSEDQAFTVKFVYDNSRELLSILLLTNLKEILGVKSEKISMESTETILGNIEEVKVFMTTSQTSVSRMVENLKAQKKELESLKTQLKFIENNFNYKYDSLKGLQKTVNQRENSVNKEILLADIDNTITSLQSAYNELNSIPEKPDSIRRATVQTYTIMQSLRDSRNTIANNLENIDELKNLFNSLVLELDIIKDYLNDASNKVNLGIVGLDEQIKEINQISEELKENTGKFSGLDKSKAGLILKPISTIMKPLLVNIDTIHVLFPTLLVMIIAFISVVFSNIVVLNETHSIAYFRNFMIPVNDMLFVAGLFITTILTTSFQVSVLLVVAQFSLGIPIMQNLGPLVVITSLLIIIFSLIGMIFGYLIKSEQTSLLVSIFFLVGVLVTSELIYPPELMSKVVAYFANISPFVVGQGLLRNILFYNVPLQDIFSKILILLGYIIVLIVILIVSKEISKRRSVA